MDAVLINNEFYNNTDGIIIDYKKLARTFHPTESREVIEYLIRINFIHHERWISELELTKVEAN